jgi:hypothetical protein
VCACHGTGGRLLKATAQTLEVGVDHLQAHSVSVYLAY